MRNIHEEAARLLRQMVQEGKDAQLVQGTIDKAGWLPGYYWWSWVECEGIVYDGPTVEPVQDYYARRQVDNVHRYTEDEMTREIERTGEYCAFEKFDREEAEIARYEEEEDVVIDEYNAALSQPTPDLRALLLTLSPSTREDLRSVLIRDQADRDAISSRLMRYRDQNGQDWADIIDFLTMYPEARRQVARLLGEIQ
jgi:DNA-directed RNA polymerase subunit F